MAQQPPDIFSGAGYLQVFKYPWVSLCCCGCTLSGQTVVIAASLNKPSSTLHRVNMHSLLYRGYIKIQSFNNSLVPAILLASIRTSSSLSDISISSLRADIS